MLKTRNKPEEIFLLQQLVGSGSTLAVASEEPKECGIMTALELVEMCRTERRGQTYYKTRGLSKEEVGSINRRV